MGKQRRYEQHRGQHHRHVQPVDGGASVSSMQDSHGNAVVRIRSRPIESSRDGWARPSTRKVSCRTQNVAKV